MPIKFTLPDNLTSFDYQKLIKEIEIHGFE